VKKKEKKKERSFHEKFKSYLQGILDKGEILVSDSYPILVYLDRG